MHQYVILDLYQALSTKGNISYGTSKSALIFAKILSKELSIYNIRVNAIAPGVVTSRMADNG